MNEKIAHIADHFRAIMELLGLDLQDPSLIKTPERVAKMYATELFSGLDPKAFPTITLFPKDPSSSDSIIFTKTHFISFCEHHFIPMIGIAYIGYIPKNELIGLSKISRVVRYFAKRPQVQERLTDQIFNALSQALGHTNIALLLDIEHLCVQARGVEDEEAMTSTFRAEGLFTLDSSLETQFFSLIQNAKISQSQIASSKTSSIEE